MVSGAPPSGTMAPMRKFQIDTTEDNAARLLRALAFDKLSDQDPLPDEILATGLLMVLQRLEDLQGDVGSLKLDVDDLTSRPQ